MLAPSLSIKAAAPSDEADIRSWLRNQPMDGEIRLTFEREPELNPSRHVEGHPNHLFVARKSGQLVGLCQRAVRPVWWDGKQEKIGYLAQLRCDQRLTGRVAPFRRGFELCNESRVADELPFDFTSILADNLRARRFLERGLPGLPRYRELGTLMTFVLPRKQPRLRCKPDLTIAQCRPEMLAALDAFLTGWGKRYALSSRWSLSDLDSNPSYLGLSIRDFLFATRGSRLVGCAAIWDQRAFKQTMVKDYGPQLKRWRSFINFGLLLKGLPKLPPPGTVLNMAYLSHIAYEPDDPDVLESLLSSACQAARCDYLVTGFDSRHPACDVLGKRARARQLRSLIYLVGDSAPNTNPIFDLEVALL